MKLVELSKHTDPGRKGFPYAIEFKIQTPKYYVTRCISDLTLKLTDIMGQSYKKHWRRKQLNRRWYIQRLDWGVHVRICFKSKKDRLLAMMMYNEKNT